MGGLDTGEKLSNDKSTEEKPTDKSTDVEKTDDVSPKTVIDGDVKVTGNFNSEQLKNINYLIDEMNKIGLKDPLAQIGVLSVINKESNFIPVNENSYATTSNDRLRKLFGKRLSKYSDEELSQLKKNDREFFNVIYAKTVGNQGGDDGYKYRGRGFNQLTGIKNYEKYGQLIGMGNKLVEDPELVNDTEIAAKIAIAFLIGNKSPSSFPKFKSKVDAASYFADINAGGSSSHRSKAIEKTENFAVA
jgi:predicted chitinase